MSRRPDIQRGFTLLEVLVALLVVALGMLAVADTMTTNAHLAATLKERTYASWIGQNVIVAMRTDGTVPETGTRSGDVEFGQGTWTWHATVSESGIENLMRIDVEVSRAGEKEVVKTVTALIGEPALPGLTQGFWVPGGQNPGETS